MPSEYRYHLFVSYSRRSDRALAKRIESFLEGFHKTIGDHVATPLQSCVDGSDFVLPPPDERGESCSREIDAVIATHLAQCRELLVLCSEEAAASPWVAQEIAWFLEHRGAAYIRVALTEGDDPLASPERYFPRDLVASGFARQACYDLRGFRRASKNWTRVDEFEREMVRLAGDLLGQPVGTLYPTWEREQRLRRARNRWAWGAALASIAALGLFAYSQFQASGRERADRLAAEAQKETQRLRAESESARADLKQREAELARREKQQEAQQRRLAEEREQTEKGLRRAAQAFELLYRNPYEALHLADSSRSGKPQPEAARALELAFRTSATRAENRRDYSALTGSGPGYLALRWRQGDVYSQVSPNGRHVLLVTERAPDGSHTEDGKEMAGDVYLLDQETTRVRELKACDPANRRRIEYVGFDPEGQHVLVTRQFYLHVYALDGACEGQANFSRVTTSPIHLAGGYVLGRFVLGADSKGGIWYTEPDGKVFSTIRREWTPERDPAVAFVIRPDGRAATIVFESGRASEILFLGPGKHQEREVRNRGVVAAAYRPGREGALALGDEDGWVFLVEQGKTVRDLRATNAAIDDIGFADGGQRLVTVAADRTVTLAPVAGGPASVVRFPLVEYDREVRRAPSPRVHQYPALFEGLGEPLKRDAIPEKIVKTEAAGGRTFLYTQEENRLWPVVAYVSDDGRFRPLQRSEDRVLGVREELGRAFLITEKGQLVVVDGNSTQSLLPQKVRFLNARVVEGKVWVGTSAGLYAVGNNGLDLLLELRGSVHGFVPDGPRVWLATARGAYLRDDDGKLYRATEGFRNIRSIHLDGGLIWMLTGTETEPGPALVGSGLRFQPVPGRASRVRSLAMKNGEVVLETPQGDVRYRNGVKQ